MDFVSHLSADGVNGTASMNNVFLIAATVSISRAMTARADRCLPWLTTRWASV